MFVMVLHLELLYKELSQLNNKNINYQIKRKGRLFEPLTKEIQMANKEMDSHSTSLVNREIKIKP